MSAPEKLTVKGAARRLLVLAMVGLGCGGSPGDRTWDVLLLTVDTLRPDYLSMNGYDRPTSPFLDSLLAEGVYFERALAPVPRTTPALASLLTGSYPHTTGVRSLVDALPWEMTTLAEAFRSFGYRTIAVPTNGMLSRERGLDAGFTVYDVAADMRAARRTTDVALRHLEAAAPDGPLFLWVHYIDPHVPYHPSAEIADGFDPDYRGPYPRNFGRQPQPGEPRSAFRTYPEGLTKSTVTHRNPLPQQVNEHVRRLYAGEIRTLDAQIERLLRHLRERHPDLVIVFAADHGESLGEHDFYFDHGDYVYNAASRVPLGFVLPRSHPWHRSGRCTGWVSLVDVAPTLFELLGREPPADMAGRFEGRSLVPCLRGEPLPARPVFIESGTSFYPKLVRGRTRNDVAGRFRAVALGDWKLIWKPFQPEDLAWELFNLGDDPHETGNLYRPDHPEALRLKRHLSQWLAKQTPEESPAAPVSERDLEALRALGYLDE